MAEHFASPFLKPRENSFDRLCTEWLSKRLSIFLHQLENKGIIFAKVNLPVPLPPRQYGKFGVEKGVLDRLWLGSAHVQICYLPTAPCFDT